LSEPAGPTLGRSRFESELAVRPSDLDMFRHVHSSRYLDYVLAARFDQMERCYGMGMPEFEKLGLAWFVRTSHVEYKRPLGLGDRLIVRTWVESIDCSEVRVHFEIDRLPQLKRSCDGWCDYTLVRVATGRAETIPEWIAEKYAC
jgi:YbgC/YbaW family acyl-CoA thioester hydrolase